MSVRLLVYCLLEALVYKILAFISVFDNEPAVWYRDYNVLTEHCSGGKQHAAIYFFLRNNAAYR